MGSQQQVFGVEQEVKHDYSVARRSDDNGTYIGLVIAIVCAVVLVVFVIKFLKKLRANCAVLVHPAPPEVELAPAAAAPDV